MIENSGNSAEKLFGNLQDMGKSWATYGLTMGKAALETSANTLKNTADFLGTVSEKLTAEEAPATEENEAEETTEEEGADLAPKN